MSAFLFIIFIVAAAAIDRCPVAGAVSLGALAILCMLSKREGPREGGKDGIQDMPMLWCKPGSG